MAQHLLMAAAVSMPMACSEVITPPPKTVTICMRAEPDPPVIARAQAIASAIFREIGVALNWQSDERFCGPAENGVPVKLLAVSRRLELPGAFAYSTPYGSRRILVFYDRIRRAVGMQAVAPLLAHVLAHEIAHTLQRTEEHSLHGIMKAHWTLEELHEMQNRPLQFQASDVMLIEAGMSSRNGARPQR